MEKTKRKNEPTLKTTYRRIVYALLVVLCLEILVIGLAMLQHAAIRTFATFHCACLSAD